MNGPVVVGVDGSHAALNAVTWAVGEARLRRLPLRITYVAVRWEYNTVAAPEPGLAAARPEAAGERVLDLAEEYARAQAPDVEIERRLGIGSVGALLLQEADEASLLVLGAHGTDASGHFSLGSVSRQTAEHSSCPVIVVPPESDPRPRRSEIVVGVDGSVASADAVRFAVEEASLRGFGLRAVHVWEHPVSLEGLRPVRYDEEAVAAEGTRLISEALAGWRDKDPGLRVAEQVVQGKPAAVLMEASRTAELVVVGARGRGGFSGLRLGSVSHKILHHAAGPVVVVPA
jgi:nucleotide-binding universal stress UspA family protein